MTALVDPKGIERTATVEVRIAASPLWFSVVRGVADQLSARARFDEDASTDLRLAVDEACGVLTDLGPAGAELTCHFALEPDRVDMEISATVSRRSNTVPTDTISWQLLRGVTDELVVRHWPATGRHPGEFHLKFTKLANQRN